jgi:5-formyltetrahydrofolate cyclo-ligase
LPQEVDTWPLFEYAWGIGKEVYVPVVDGERLLHVPVTRATTWQQGAFGITEPDRHDDAVPDTHFSAADVVVVPMAAFDARLHRIGYGKGYYDQFLSHTDAVRVGVAYEVQRVPHIPHEDSDVPMHAIATEERWYVP